MMKLRIVWMTLILVIASSCQTTLKDERANLKATQTVYTSVVKQVMALRKADKLSNGDFAHAKIISAIISKQLTIWNDALQAGKTRPDIADTIAKNMNILGAILTKHKEPE